jgi:hypothetical protein
LRISASARSFIRGAALALAAAVNAARLVLLAVAVLRAL